MTEKPYQRPGANRIRIVLFLGMINQWLWYIGHANLVAAVLGGGFLAVSVVLAWQMYRNSPSQ